MPKQASQYHPAAMSQSFALHGLAKEAVVRSDDERGGGKVFVEAPDKNFARNAPAAVVLAVTAAEAGINEICALPIMIKHELILPDDFVELPLRTKFLLLPQIVSGRTYDKGAAPWQDFDAVVSLRDRFVHFKFGSAVPRCMNHLLSRNLALRDQRFDWASAASTNKVALWAVNTVADVFSELERLLEKDSDQSWAWGRHGFTRMP